MFHSNPNYMIKFNEIKYSLVPTFTSEYRNLICDYEIQPEIYRRLRI